MKLDYLDNGLNGINILLFINWVNPNKNNFVKRWLYKLLNKLKKIILIPKINK